VHDAGYDQESEQVESLLRCHFHYIPLYEVATTFAAG
jgi:hypothetical protein